MARRLAARDTDPGDEVTGWEIVGGTDPGQFTITSDTGELSFRTATDFEAPGDNAYEVTVEVRSGGGGEGTGGRADVHGPSDGRTGTAGCSGDDGLLGGNGREPNGALERTGQHGPPDHRL